ncbi:MAG: amidase [Actinomycetota bacterium]
MSDVSASNTPLLVADGGPFVVHLPDAIGAEGPLAGWDVAVKDLVAVSGLAATAGLAEPLAETATDDAPVVARLRAAGARIVGTTALHQLACGVTGVNLAQGTPINPAAPDRCPGGSGSGSAAAVAAGLVRMAIGTDTGGSVRLPSAACGVVGWKPARGRLPLDGVIPCAPSLDHVGVHTATVADAITSLAALGLDDLRSVAPSPPGRLGVVRREVEGSADEVRAAVDDAFDRLERSGWELVDVEWPSGDDIAATSTTILLGEFARVHAHERPGLDDRVGADILDRLDRGEAIGDVQVTDALTHRDALRRTVDAALSDVDVVAGPTLPILPPPIDDARADDGTLARALVSHTRLANCTGHPAVSIPLPTPLPVGIQVLAGSDAALAAHATTIERDLRSDR